MTPNFTLNFETHKNVSDNFWVYISVVRLPNQVYELVNKRTKFTVVYGCLPPIFGGRVRLQVRLRRISTSGSLKVYLPITSVQVCLPNVRFPKVRFPPNSQLVRLPMGCLRCV